MYVDFLRLVLEMINTVVSGCLPQNPELVYALLHRQDVLAPLQVGGRWPGSWQLAWQLTCTFLGP